MRISEPGRSCRKKKRRKKRPLEKTNTNNHHHHHHHSISRDDVPHSTPSYSAEAGQRQEIVRITETK
eukprot:gene6335-4562_t